jgi:hypothetical protein
VRKLGKFSRVPLRTVRRLLAAAQRDLPVTGVNAVTFLACLVDSATAWKAKCDAALKSDAALADPEADPEAQQPEAAPGQSEATEEAATAALATEGAEGAASSLTSLRRVSQLISEGTSLEVDMSAELRGLRRSVWVIVARTLTQQPAANTPPADAVVAVDASGPGGVGSAVDATGADVLALFSPPALCVDLDLLLGMVDGGRGLGLDIQSAAGDGQEVFAAVAAAVSGITSWLVEAETLPFGSDELLALADRALGVRRLHLGGEVGFRRLLAARVHRHQTLRKQQPATGQSAIIADDLAGPYCLCRGGDDGSAMVECEVCAEWFHAACLGLGAKELGTSKRKNGDIADTATGFQCPVCSEVAKSEVGPAAGAGVGTVASAKTSTAGSKALPKRKAAKKAPLFVDSDGAEVLPALTAWQLFSAQERPRVELAVSEEASAAAAAAEAAAAAAAAETVVEANEGLAPPAVVPVAGAWGASDQRRVVQQRLATAWNALGTDERRPFADGAEAECGRHAAAMASNPANALTVARLEAEKQVRSDLRREERRQREALASENYRRAQQSSQQAAQQAAQPLVVPFLAGAFGSFAVPVVGPVASLVAGPVTGAVAGAAVGSAAGPAVGSVAGAAQADAAR